MKPRPPTRKDIERARRIEAAKRKARARESVSGLRRDLFDVLALAEAMATEGGGYGTVLWHERMDAIARVRAAFGLKG